MRDGSSNTGRPLRAVAVGTPRRQPQVVERDRPAGTPRRACARVSTCSSVEQPERIARADVRRADLPDAALGAVQLHRAADPLVAAGARLPAQAHGADLPDLRQLVLRSGQHRLRELLVDLEAGEGQRLAVRDAQRQRHALAGEGAVLRQQALVLHAAQRPARPQRRAAAGEQHAEPEHRDDAAARDDAGDDDRQRSPRPQLAHAAHGPNPRPGRAVRRAARAPGSRRRARAAATAIRA